MLKMLIHPLIVCAFLMTFACVQKSRPDPLTTLQKTPTAPSAILEGIYRALKDNYPMPELAGWRGEEWFQEFKTKVAAAPTREEAFGLMDEFVCRLNDYHTRLDWPGRPTEAGPPVQVGPALATSNLPTDYGIWGRLHPPIEMPVLEGVPIAVMQAAEGIGLRPGDEIVGVDGVPVQEALARAWRRAVGSSVGGKLRAASQRLLRGKPNSELQLRVRRGSVLEDVVVARSGSLPEVTLSHREVDGVPVIRITLWGGEDLIANFDHLLDEAQDRPGLIIDVRGNSGGMDELAAGVVARFIATPVIGSISFHRVVPSTTFNRLVDIIAPRGPQRYGGRVAILIDEGCRSACEHFVSGMIEAGALASGTPTSGACGLARPVALPGGVVLYVSRTFPLHTGGIPSPQLGMAPHIWAPPSLGDLRNGRDTAMTAVLVWIKSKAPLPVRLQPIWPISP